MRSKKGIALITSLLIMVVVMALGVGSLSLAMMDIKIAENVRSQAIAEADAEENINAAILALNTYFNTPANNKKFPTSTSANKFPSTFSIPHINDVQTFPPNDYTYISNADQSGYTLTVKGRSVSGGLHLSEVLMGTSTGPGLTNSIYGKGLISEGEVTINGNNNTFYDVMIHGNAGLTYNSPNEWSFYNCTVRLLAGACTLGTHQVDLLTLLNLRKGTEVYNSTVGNQLPVQTGNSATKCNQANSIVCGSNGARKKVAPITIDVTYTSARDAAIRASDVSKATPARAGDGKKFAGVSCDKTYSTMPGSLNSVDDVKRNFLGSHKVICVETGNVTLPSGVDLTGVTIISNGGMNFNGAPTLNKSQLISLGGGININGAPTITDSKIFSNEDLNLNSSSSSFLGDTTIASAKNVNINGTSRETRNAGSYSIGLAVIAGGNITAGGGGNSEWYASFVSGGTTIFNGGGNLKLHGGVTSKGNIILNGGIELDSGMAVSNTSLTNSVTPTPILLSRR